MLPKHLNKHVFLFVNKWDDLQSPPDLNKPQDTCPQIFPRTVNSASTLPPDWLPSDQGRNNVSDGAVEVCQHLLNRSSNGQLLTQVFSTTHLLPVLTDDLSQFLAPGERRGNQEATARHVQSRRRLPGMFRCPPNILTTSLLSITYTCAWWEWKAPSSQSWFRRHWKQKNVDKTNCFWLPLQSRLGPGACTYFYLTTFPLKIITAQSYLDLRLVPH